MVGRPAAPSPPYPLLPLLLLIALSSCTSPTDPARPVVIERVVDGDTVLLTGGEYVRLLGLDAPELAGAECYAGEAAAFLTLLVSQAGSRLLLTLDEVETDRFGRTLGYLWDTEGAFVNEELLREGFARFTRGDAERWGDRLERAGAEAEAALRGLWHPAACGSAWLPSAEDDPQPEHEPVRARSAAGRRDPFDHQE